MNPSRHRKESSSSSLWERWESVGLKLLDDSGIEGEELRVSQAAAPDPWDIESDLCLPSLLQGRCISSNRLLPLTTLSEAPKPLLHHSLAGMADLTATL